MVGLMGIARVDERRFTPDKCTHYKTCLERQRLIDTNALDYLSNLNATVCYFRAGEGCLTKAKLSRLNKTINEI